MKRNTPNTIIALVMVLFLFFPLMTLQAENGPSGGYQPLTDLFDSPVGGDFSPYVESVLYLLIFVAAVLAVIIITIAGLQWMASGASVSSVEQAKSKIQNAIGGLILLLIAVLILQTINPALLDFRIDGEAVNVADGAERTRCVSWWWIGGEQRALNKCLALRQELDTVTRFSAEDVAGDGAFRVLQGCHRPTGTRKVTIVGVSPSAPGAPSQPRSYEQEFEKREWCFTYQAIY